MRKNYVHVSYTWYKYLMWWNVSWGKPILITACSMEPWSFRLQSCIIYFVSSKACDMVLTWKNRTRIKPFIAKKVLIVYDAIFHCSHSNSKLYYPLCTLKFNHAIQSLSSKISIKLLKTILERWILSIIFHI